MATDRQPEQRWFVVGDLGLRTLSRSFGGDGGPSLELYVRTAGDAWRRVARYDCFRDFPHRHLWHVDGHEERARWGQGSTAAAIAATEQELRGGLAAILRQVGYPGVAASLEPQVLHTTIDEVVADLQARAAGDSPTR